MTIFLKISLHLIKKSSELIDLFWVLAMLWPDKKVSREHKQLKTLHAEMYLEPCQTSKMEFLRKS